LFNYGVPVSTATLVAPRVTFPSLNRTNILLCAGSKVTFPEAVAKTAKVGVAPAGMTDVTEGAIGEVHCPVAGFVEQIAKDSGSETLPVSAVAVIVPVAPTFEVATAKAPAPVGFGILTRPSLPGVAATATMSGTGVVEAEKSSVSSPVMIGARTFPPH
jgi:hypothetical protein